LKETNFKLKRNKGENRPGAQQAQPMKNQNRNLGFARHASVFGKQREGINFHGVVGWAYVSLFPYNICTS
jgi:hypothetical protein